MNDVSHAAPAPNGPFALDPLHVLKLRSQVGAHPYPLLFATISGAHLYGFASRDSDYDLRGVHRLPLTELVALTVGDTTVERMRVDDGLEIDLVTHEIGKFCSLLLKKNGYVLEQLLSPLVVQSSPWHAELVALAPGCVTRHHGHHYLGFAATQWKLFRKDEPPRVKPLLYTYRVLLTGIHLMRTGEVEANLRRLNEAMRLLYIDELIARKTGGNEKGRLEQADLAFHESEVGRLTALLEQAQHESRLPELPPAGAAVREFAVRARLATE
jgi:hypothetical protein